MLSCAETFWVDAHHHVVWLQEKPLEKEKGSQGRRICPVLLSGSSPHLQAKGLGLSFA